MKKLLVLLFVLVGMVTLASCGGDDKLVVYTEAGFAPFEYVKDGAITGVDVDIMNLVGEKLGKKVVFENVAFDTIVDTVSAGKLTNVGAAGLSITDERKEKVDFSTVYYQANLYVIYKEESGIDSKTMTDGNEGVYWSSLQTEKGIGVQTGTTADLFLGDELAEGGSLEGVKKSDFDSLDVAVKDIGLNIDYVIIDELPAKMLVEGNDGLACLPLYYEGEEGADDELAFDSYAICVTKGQEELLKAINEVLADLLKEDENGVTGVQKLVNKHLGLE
jgi:polar amino acid transport system substrate-binding protein